MFKKYGGCTDQPDERDFKASQILGAPTGEIPDYVNLLNGLEAYNQNSSNHCTSYALTHVHSILNTIEHQFKVYFDPEEQWKNQLLTGAKEEIGDTLQNAVKTLFKNALTFDYRKYPITGYATINKDELKAWLAKGFPIFTGSAVTKTNYTKARDTGFWGGIDGTIVGGHAIALTGFDANGWLCRNSYGDSWGKYGNGTFYVRYGDEMKLFSMYIIYDKKDINYLFKDVSDQSEAYEAIKYCLENKIMLGYGEGDPKDRFFKPDQPITRAEVAQVIYNLKK